MQTFKSIRGFNDVLPSKITKYQFVEKTIQSILNNADYKEIRTPIVEFEDLFKRSVGSESDIVSKEMYTIKRDEETAYTLRPEGTVGVARALLEGNLTDVQQKLWYNGYMFRAENPQKGRYRQFQQIGVEVYGIAGINADIELLNLSYSIFEKFNLLKSVSLEINNIGSMDDRRKYANSIINYMKPYYNQLSENFIKKFERNPLRILDNKDEKIKLMIKDAPSISDYINESSKNNFEKLKYALDSLGIEYKINEKLIRGLDYYNDLVFEWTSNLSESQGTVCAGGRYDTLMEQLNGPKTPAVGFAIGVERLILLLEETESYKDTENNRIVICVIDKDNYIFGLKIQKDLMNSLNQSVGIVTEQTSLKSQMKKADKMNARYVLIFGSNEIDENKVSVKDMLYGTQETMNIEMFINTLK
jgi:histidyl-tRNA synthetase